MDYAAFLYLNPELCLLRNISTVEGAKFYLDALSAAERAAADADLSVVPVAFEPAVYIADGGLALDVSLLDSFVRAQSLEEGLTQHQVWKRDHNQSYADNLVQDLTRESAAAPGTLRFRYTTFMTTANVMLDDRVRLLVDDTDFFRAVVTAVDYNARTISLAPETGALPLPAGATRYRLYSVLVADVRRIAIINYVRRATGRTAKTTFDPEFNLRLYHLLYPDSRLMQRDTAYVDYLGRMNTDDFRVGKEPDLLLSNEEFIFPTMRFSDVEITGNAAFLGGATFCNTAHFADTIVGGLLSVGSNVSVGGELAVAGATAFGDSVTVSNALHVSGPTTLSNTLDVTGVATLRNDLIVAGDTDLRGAVDVSGPVAMSNALAVTGPTTLSDTLDVTGAATLRNDLIVAGDTDLRGALDVSGPVAMSNALAVTGPTTLSDTLDVTGVATLRNDLVVAGDTDLRGALDVSGPVAMSNALTVTGAATLGNDLLVAGDTGLRGALDVAGPVTMSNALTVTGAATLGNDLLVAGDTDLRGALDVSGPVAMSNALAVIGPTTLGDDLLVAGDTDLRGALDVSGPTTLSNTLTVTGAATLGDDLLVAGDTDLRGDLEVSGPVTLSNSLAVIGPTTLGDDLLVAGDTDLRGALEVSGPVTLSNSLAVIGPTALGDDLLVAGDTDLRGDLEVSGPVTMSNALGVIGPTTLGDLLVAGDTDLRGSLDVSGPATLSNTLAVIGPTTLGDDLLVAGNTNLRGALDVSGPATLSNTLTVTGVATLGDDLHVAGDAYLRGALDVSGPATLSNTLAVMGPATLGDGLLVSGNTDLRGNLDVSGPATLSNTLAVMGPATLGDGLLVAGDTDLRGNLDVSGPATLSNALAVIGPTTLGDDLLVAGDTDLRGALDASGPATLSNTLSVIGPTTLGDGLLVAGDTDLRGALDVSGPATMSNSLAVIGPTTLGDDLLVAGDTDLRGNLDVSGPATMSNALAVMGAATLRDDLLVAGDTDLRGALEVYGPATMSNALAVMGAATLRDDLLVAGDTDLRGALEVSGPVTLSNSLAVIGPTTLGDDLLVAGNTDLRGSLEVSGPVSLSNALAVAGPTTLSNTLDVTGAVTFGDGLLVAGGTVFQGSLDVSGAAAFGEASFAGVRVAESLVLPVGDSVSRPDDIAGSIRYNTELRAFEGYTDAGDGGWSSLGGAVDGDRDTFVAVEESPGADDDTMRFVTSGVERLRITDQGRFLFSAAPAATSNPPQCDFVFDGRACFQDVAVAGKMSVGDVDDLSEALSILSTLTSALDPPYVEDFEFFPIPGSSNLGGSVTVESASDFRVYAYATLPGADTLDDPLMWKRFYTRQLARNNGGAFSVSYVANPVGMSGFVEFAGVEVGMYFESTSTAAPVAPRVMENYHVYRMHLLVEDLVGRKTIAKQFSVPMVGTLRTNDVVAPTIGASEALAVGAAVGGGRIDVKVLGLEDDGIGAEEYDGGAGTFGAPVSAYPPRVAAHAVALDRFQSFDDVDEAFAMLEAGCNVESSLCNADPGDLSLTTYYTRLGYGQFSAERPMGNYRYYSPYVLVQDFHDPPNRAIRRMPDTVTLDQVPPEMAGAAGAPFADFATSNVHEMVFSVDGVVDDTKCLLYAWLMAGDHAFASADAARAFVDARGAALIPPREMQPYEDREFMPPMYHDGEIRLRDAFAESGARVAALGELTEYTAQTLVVDAAGNATYERRSAVHTRDTLGPAVSAGAVRSSQTVRTVAPGPAATASAIRVSGFEMFDELHAFTVYLFSFDASPPDADAIKRRLRDGVYTAAHFASARVTKGVSTPVDLSFAGVVSTGDAPAVSALQHETVSHPVVFALDDANRADLELSNGNAVLLPSEHVSEAPAEPGGAASITVDQEPPQLAGFAVLPRNAFDPSIPGSVGHPFVRVSFELSDRHPLEAWLYYTTSAVDAAEMAAGSAADRLVDPGAHGGLPSSGAITGRVEVSQYSDGAEFDLDEPVEENRRYHFFLGTKDHHNNRAVYASAPPSVYIMPLDPVVVSYTFDVRTSLGAVSPLASGYTGSPDASLANTLDVSVSAEDRGRGGLDRVFFYYTTDGAEQPDAATLLDLATALDGASVAGAPTGGRVWVVAPRADSFSGSHVTARLPESSPVYLHSAAIDGFGNFSAVVRDDLGSALTPHAGLSYDVTVPAATALSATLHAFDAASRDTKMDIVFEASDAGGAGLARLYIYYSVTGGARTPAQVRSLAQATAPGGTQGGYVVVTADSGAGPASVTSPDLVEWSKFWVYAVAEDGDGNLSRDGAGHADRAQMVGNYAYAGVAGADVADSRTWDYQPPAMSL
eukprot:jgi/Tetstr1/454261/TSEL_041180.t1